MNHYVIHLHPPCHSEPLAAFKDANPSPVAPSALAPCRGVALRSPRAQVARLRGEVPRDDSEDPLPGDAGGQGDARREAELRQQRWVALMVGGNSAGEEGG
eukprot:Skav201414  [mRNA]  locus=scaffold4849:30067:30369:+ [translate_table: standard]